MHTNADATLYNKVISSGRETWIRTVLRSVFWAGGEAAKLDASGYSPDSKVGSKTDVMIPFGVDAEEKKYLPPKQYQSMPDKADFWTIQCGDRMVKGVVDLEPERISDLERQYGDVITIDAVETNDYGSPHMHYWGVTGA